MGEAADRKVKEIEQTRRRLESDLRELEERLPSPLRSGKSLAGLILGSVAVMTVLVRLLRSKRRDTPPSAEVVVRIVRDDLEP